MLKSSHIHQKCDSTGCNRYLRDGGQIPEVQEIVFEAQCLFDQQPLHTVARLVQHAGSMWASKGCVSTQQLRVGAAITYRGGGGEQQCDTEDRQPMACYPETLTYSSLPTPRAGDCQAATRKQPGWIPHCTTTSRLTSLQPTLPARTQDCRPCHVGMEENVLVLGCANQLHHRMRRRAQFIDRRELGFLRNH